GAAATWLRLLPGLLGLQGRLRVFIEDYRGQLRSTALVYDGHRPEWVVLTLAAPARPSSRPASTRTPARRGTSRRSRRSPRRRGRSPRGARPAATRTTSSASTS